MDDRVSPASQPLSLQCSDDLVGAASLADMLVVADALLVVAARTSQSKVLGISGISSRTQRKNVLDRCASRTPFGYAELPATVDALAHPDPPTGR